MTYYTIKLDDTIHLTGNIVPSRPIDEPPRPIPEPVKFKNEEYSFFEISGDLIVEGSIIGTGSLSNLILSDTAPPSTSESNIKGKIIYSNNFLYLCIDDEGTWIRWPVGLV
jgi:hypothetical protein